MISAQANTSNRSPQNSSDWSIYLLGFDRKECGGYNFLVKKLATFVSKATCIVLNAINIDSV